MEVPFGYSGFPLSMHNKNGAAISIIPFQRMPFFANLPKLAPKSLSHCPWLVLSSTLRLPLYLSSPSEMGERWENDGRTMGELRTKEWRESGRAYIGRRGGKQNKTVIISLSIPHVTALPLNGSRQRLT